MSADREPGATDIDYEQVVRKLATLIDDTGLTEIEIEQGGLRVRVARHQATVVASPPAGVAVPVPGSTPLASGGVTDPTQHPGVVTSPMVGTAYRAPEPGGRPFVEVGSVVEAGAPLLIIEAMKTMNQIPAPRAGTVVQILFEDAQPVEFGEPLLIIE
jgi:acetyl-CoA carboxylase biotin carboxyl carrier protein